MAVNTCWTPGRGCARGVRLGRVRCGESVKRCQMGRVRVPHRPRLESRQGMMVKLDIGGIGLLNIYRILGFYFLVDGGPEQ